ncbi:MAG: LPXTG cell wall anchor domain-containing protein [Streptococcaceae bacterium]|jgi:LPXTG-motif cell wall-anchored protein|nr:LPXTG cell wall anchor domain-containing protein [Streptococcaceae bacterium]
MKLLGNKHRILFLILGFLLLYGTNLVEAATFEVQVNLLTQDDGAVSNMPMKIYNIDNSLSKFPAKPNETPHDYYTRYAQAVENGEVNEALWADVAPSMSSNAKGEITFTLPDTSGLYILVQAGNTVEYEVHPSIFQLPTYDINTGQMNSVTVIDPKVTHNLQPPASTTTQSSVTRVSPPRTRAPLPRAGERIAIWLMVIGFMIIGGVFAFQYQRKKRKFIEIDKEFKKSKFGRKGKENE